MQLEVLVQTMKTTFRTSRWPALAAGLLLGERYPIQESPPHGFQPLKEGVCRLLSEPTPSPRLCISAKGATPQRTRPDYHALLEGLTQTGTFYFAGKRNFLLCLDSCL